MPWIIKDQTFKTYENVPVYNKAILQ